MYQFYKFKHNTMDRVIIALKCTKGDPDLFVGNHECPYPDNSWSIWRHSEYGEDKIVLHSFDKGFVVGYMYVSVRGTTDASYSLVVKWREEGEPGEEDVAGVVKYPHRNEKIRCVP